MPTRRVTTKAPAEVKEPVKRSTRTIKNKRELSDDELVIDVKKKKVADKVPSKVTTKQAKTTAASKRKQTEPVEETVEPIDSKQPVTKRKRPTTTKESKSAKIKKDANDNELVDDEQTNEENDIPSASQPKTTRGRAKKAAVDNIVEVQKPSVAASKRGKSRSKKTDEEEQPIDEPVVEESEQPVKKGRNKKQQSTVVDEQPKKRSGRLKKETVQENELTEEPVVESQPILKRGRVGTKKESENKTEETTETQSQPAPVKKSARSRSKTQPEEEIAVASQPDRTTTTKRATSRGKKAIENKSDVKVTENVKPATTKRVGRKPASQELDTAGDHAEADESENSNIVKKSGRGRKTAPVKTIEKSPINDESEKDMESEIETQEQLLTKPPAKKGRGRTKVTTAVEPVEETEKEKTTDEHVEKEEIESEPQSTEPIPKKGRGRTKVTTAVEPVEETEKEKTTDEHVEKEEIETEPQSTEPIPKKGRGRTKVAATRKGKADQESVHEEEHLETEEVLEIQSQPAITESVSTKRGRKPSRKVQENNDFQTQSQPVTSTSNDQPNPVKKRGRAKKAVAEEIVKPIVAEVENRMQLDDEFDDNKSEKDLVIDLPEEPPKKQPRARKAVKEFVAPALVETEIEEPAPKRGRTKKQQHQEVPSNTENQKSKTDEIVVSSSNENLIDEQISDQQKVPPVAVEVATKRASKRGRPAARTKSSEEQPKLVEETTEIVEKPPGKESELKLAQDKTIEEKAVTSKDTKKDEKDESSCSLDESIKQNEIDNVIEFMKSAIEKSFLEASLLEQSSSTRPEIPQDETSSSSLNDSNEVIPAKDLEETYAELPNVSGSSSEELKLTYESIAFQANYSKTNEAATLNSFGNSELEFSDRKRVKLSHVSDRLELPKISNGRILAFGDNTIGELGIGKITNGRSSPIEIVVRDDFCYVHTLSQHSICINSKGQLYTFGNNDEYALGRKTAMIADQDDNDEFVLENQRKQESLESTPTICDLNRAYRICKATCGDSHTAVLETNGSVFYWGNFRDNNGSIGLSVEKLRATLEPEKIDSELDIVDIASGANFLLLLDSFGTVYSLGVGDVGQLGRLENEECKFNKQKRELYLKPHPIEFPKNVKINAIWAGEFDAFARSTDNRLFAWGLNNFCQLGFKQEGTESNADQCVLKPKEVPYFTKLSNRIEKVACGQHHSIVLDDRGMVYAFGRREYGRLGLGEIKEDAEYPKMIESFKNTKVIDISCGATTSFAITSDGKLYSWGMGSRQLCQGKDSDDIYVPTQVKMNSIENFTAIKVSAGSSHCLVLGQLTKDGEINNNAVRNGV